MKSGNRPQHDHFLTNFGVFEWLYLVNEALGNKPHKLCSYSPEPRTEVYCFRLNFNISKLVYCMHVLSTASRNARIKILLSFAVDGYTNENLLFQSVKTLVFVFPVFHTSRLGNTVAISELYDNFCSAFQLHIG